MSDLLVTNATLPDGRQHTVDGFLTVVDKKITELPDAVVGELHRSGVLGLIHAHQISLGNMARLVEWHVARLAGRRVHRSHGHQQRVAVRGADVGALGGGAGRQPQPACG